MTFGTDLNCKTLQREIERWIFLLLILRYEVLKTDFVILKFPIFQKTSHFICSFQSIVNIWKTKHVKNML